jgi:hypothetical protein
MKKIEIFRAVDVVFYELFQCPVAPEYIAVVSYL